MAVLALAVLAVIGVRVRLLQIPLERDEGEYAYAGQLMLEGIPPYKLAYNMKLPGTYAAYAGIMAVFGQTPEGIHFGFLLVNLATLALLFFVARRLLDEPHAVVACICYSLLSMSRGVMGLEGHATHLVVLAALAGLLLLLKARESGKPLSFAWSGLMFGLSLVCKQPGLVFGLLGVTILLRDWFKGEGSRRANGVKHIIFFCVAGAAPFLLVCGWMALAGTFDRFWFWTVEYARAHARVLDWKMGEGDLAAFYEQAESLRWAWPVAVAGLVCLILGQARADAKFIVGGLLAFSLFAFTASFYFFPHYFIMVLPAIALLIAVAFRSAAAALGEWAPNACLALVCALFLHAHQSLWFEQSPDQASRTLCGDNPFPEAEQIGHYIREHSQSSDTIAIIGSEPEICFYAHRHSATGYIYMYDLMQTHEYAATMQKEMMQQIEAAKPAFMLLINVPLSWGMSTKSDLSIENWAFSYAEKYYGVAGKYWMFADHTEFAWGRDASIKKDAPRSITILQRRPDS
jgi:hypothetical protein